MFSPEFLVVFSIGPLRLMVGIHESGDVHKDEVIECIGIVGCIFLGNIFATRIRSKCESDEMKMKN